MLYGTRTRFWFAVRAETNVILASEKSPDWMDALHLSIDQAAR